MTPRRSQGRKRGEPLTKSEQMARVRSSETQPELALRRALWAAGFRYRVRPALPGTPDLAFVRARIAVFVDGCFWHGCPEHYTAPRANASFWGAKLERNQARDARVDAQLAEMGWRSIRMWEHEITASPIRAVERIRLLLGNRTGTSGEPYGCPNMESEVAVQARPVEATPDVR